MLTQNEINSLSLSPTKKDFVQIWNELLEVAGKLSERWDPTSTNESDPGIVILKALAGIADKLNYNIDKNILEAFMPTAAQEDSMRKLCDMLGYNIKYYQSATTEVTIKYHNSDPSAEESEALAGNLLIPKFTVITNSDKDINYFTINPTPRYISATSTVTKPAIPCMEGQIVKCEGTNDNNIISANQITENNRFYLPEVQIAENGIFVYNVFNSENSGRTSLEDGTPWEKVDNLNIQVRGSRVYKFGFDSYEGRPYLEFPEDYSELFNDGLFIYYARTSGINGNISPKTLTQLELPSSWQGVSAESFSVENTFAATTGANIETIKQAYNNYKKTIGTFETLVTCRDYMNKIYAMVNEIGKPYVSNVLVTDIRNDLNRAVTICSCDDAGIFYKESSLLDGYNIIKTKIETETKTETNANTPEEEIVHETFILSTVNKPYYKPTGNCWFINVYNPGGEQQDQSVWIPVTKDKLLAAASDSTEYTDFSMDKEGTALEGTDENEGYWVIRQFHSSSNKNKLYKTKLPIEKIPSITTTKQAVKTVITTNNIINTVEESRAIDHFDLVLYPFKSYNQIKSNVKNIREVYDASFNYNLGVFNTIKNSLETNNLNTISHNIISPRDGDILSINNYLKLNANIATNSKITTEEGALIIDKIKIALANAFNMRELDFGEEIPFDSIVEVIEKADARIRVASLNEPALYTTFSVLVGKDVYGNPITREYAVASDWLTVEAAEETSRFEYTDENDNIIKTFNTIEAKKIYNKLAVRNILAGRVPLFNYNNVYSSSFSEGAYYVTEKADIIPEKMPVPDDTNPFTIYTKEDILYTGQYINEDDKPVIVYTKTYVPDFCKGNVITSIKDNYITDISTNLSIKAEDGNISDVTLASGELIKFRAPNFTTIKTYPAYVNYHLALNKEIKSEAYNAQATSLFELLNADIKDWSETNTKIGWQKMLDYFTEVDKLNGTNYKKSKPMQLTISKYTPFTGNNGNTDSSSSDLKDITIKIDNSTQEDGDQTLVNLAKSGCLKITNEGLKARLAWSDAYGDTIPSTPVPDLNFTLDLSSPFITNESDITKIRETIQSEIYARKDKVDKDTGKPVLPDNCAWTISFDLEWVPFEIATLSGWETFAKSEKARDIFKFAPVVEHNNVFWRVYGEGYNTGKYILEDGGKKLLKFDRTYFGLLSDVPLRDIYISSNLGKDKEPSIIENNDEYMLADNEYLYIEYTPASTTTDSNSQEPKPITEVYGAGTIIRPSGFEQNLIDSTVYESLGNSAFKTVTFEVDGGLHKIDMQRFGANEQVEIRDFSRVVLSKDTFKNTSGIYVYKNFNNCEELTKLVLEEGVRKNNTYTLKDGEYIFYTDQNKAELAYFTTGTQITLTGKTVLPDSDIIDLSTIFESGIQEIPWTYMSFSGNDDSIIFQEYQYVTLGVNDTIKNIKLLGQGQTDRLTGEWQYCDNVTYTLAGLEELKKLPNVYTYKDNKEINTGNGWQVCSALELVASPNNVQILRKDDKIETELVISSTSAGGLVEETATSTITPQSADYPLSTVYPLSIKTNLVCEIGSNKININEVYNPDKLKGFELKFSAFDEPAIVKTEPNKVIPYKDPYKTKNITDMALWPGTALQSKDYLELWTTVNLDDISIKITDTDYDSALKLPINLIPNTYGIFSIYVFNSATENTAKTWIEVTPGTSHEDIVLVNSIHTDNPELDWVLGDTNKNESDRLYLQPGINCIRVNKTGRLFIKASDQAQGTLYFDELKLVNCQPVAYSIGNSTTTMDTYGLNIEQLGYLDTFSTETFEVEMRNKYMEACAEKTYAGLDASIQEDNETISQLTTKALKDKSKISTIVATVEAAKKEIDNLLTLYPKVGTDDHSYIKGLFAKYQELNDSLTREKALLEALDENKNNSDLEQQLVSLLESFSAIEVAQQQLLTELNNLKTEVTNTKEFSKEEVLIDFNNNIKNISFEDFKAIYLAVLDTNYNKQLATLADSIGKVYNSEERNNLIAILNDLKAASSSDSRVRLAGKLNSLLEMLDKSELSALTDSMYKLALEKEYVSLASSVVQLRSYFSNRAVTQVLSEIEEAFNNENDKYLLELLNNFETILNSSPSTGTDSVSEAINTLLATLESSSPNANTVVKQTKALCTKAEAEFNTKINSIKVALTPILTELTAGTYNEVEYLNAIAKLQNSEDTQVKDIITKLKELSDDIATNTTSFNDLQSSGLANYKNVPFGEEAAILMWSAKMKQTLLDGINTLYSCISTAIILLDTKTEPSNPFSSTIIAKAAKVDNFLDIFNKVENLVNRNIQSSASKSFITEVSSTLLPLSENITSAMNEITTNNSGRNLALIEIIKELRELLSLDVKNKDSKDIIKQQQLAKSLKEELDNAINEDKQLFKIVTNIICPSISKVEELQLDIANDSFYDKFLELFENIKVMISNSTKHTATLDKISKELHDVILSDGSLLKALEASATGLINFTSKLPYESEDPAGYTQAYVAQSILPTSYHSILGDIQTIVIRMHWIEKAMSADFFTKGYFNGDFSKESASSIITNWTMLNISDENVAKILNVLSIEIKAVETETAVTASFLTAYNILKTEEQLLADIRKVDVDRAFYYTAPVELNLSIDFNTSDATLNTLMNPITNYDINNINNSFVISKLDIDYLDKGIQIARSSRLN